jgi:hypothetical protein
MLAAFLLLGLICTLLVFLIQQFSKRQLTRFQKQLFLVEERNRELVVTLSDQAKETARLLEEAGLPLCPVEQDKQFLELSATHLQLRKQFEEKSCILNQTRKELFALEGQLFTLQKEKLEQECTLDAECQELLECLQQSQEEQHTLEVELELLEQLVSSLLSQKPKTTRRKKGEEEDFFFMQVQK